MANAAERGIITPETNSFSTPEKILDGKFKGKDILSMEQFSPSSIDKLFKLTQIMSKIAKDGKPNDALKGKLFTLLFYEPSSRTRGSFDAAIKQLGGQTIVIENPQQFSSVAKGETFEDSIKTFEAYCDAIVLRHPQAGSSQKAAEVAKFVPIINAGDGIGEHPTQALLDLYTIWEKKKTLSNLKGLITGDIKNGRTVHSLLKGLSLYKNSEVYLLSPEELKLDKSLLEELRSKGLKITEITKEEDIPKDCDFWYWTRVQKERFQNQEDYEKVKNIFIATPRLLKERGNKNMILLHPLPRVGEITEDVDRDERAVYLTNQIRNGMYIRMSIAALALGKERSWQILKEELKFWK
ncbi:MAG: aspartate carbamoyltransferase [Candidatus Levybacteria bacterium]|nr:aspartate carbamoyltransferase [Candidatus Levybacteria bacterium]